MRRKLFIICVLLAGMGGLFLAHEPHSNSSFSNGRSQQIVLQLDSLLTLVKSLSAEGENTRILDEVDYAEKLILKHNQDSFYLSVFVSSEEMCFTRWENTIRQLSV